MSEQINPGDVVVVQRIMAVCGPEYYKAKVLEVSRAEDYRHNDVLIVKPVSGLFRRKRFVQALWVLKLQSKDVAELERMMQS